MASHTHFVPTTGSKSAGTDAKLTPKECYDIGKFSATHNFRVKALTYKMLGNRKMICNFALFFLYNCIVQNASLHWFFPVGLCPIYIKSSTPNTIRQSYCHNRWLTQTAREAYTWLQQPQWLPSLKMKYTIQILRTMTAEMYTLVHMVRTRG